MDINMTDNQKSVGTTILGILIFGAIAFAIGYGLKKGSAAANS